MRRQGLEREALPQIFMSLAQNPPSQHVNLFVRTSSDDLLAMAGSLREAVRRVEKNAPVSGMAPLEQQFATYLAQRRFQTVLLIGFSIVALVMAAVGIYGLIQYSITTRTREIGIRMAVGAQAGEIFRMILGEGLKLSLTGLMLGLVGALWLGQVGSSLLFGVAPTDPSTFIVVALLLIAVTAAACCFPARRAMRIEPIVALRQE
jgi:ABC-type antimicrobial peptide transport system permease subunit